jgi:hypothetical protein
MLLVAIAAVHRPGAIGLEGNLTRLSALCAGGIVHLSRAAVVAAPAAASISFHLDSLAFGTDSMNRSYYKTFHQTQLIRRLCSISIKEKLLYISIGKTLQDYVTLISSAGLAAIFSTCKNKSCRAFLSNPAPI